MVILMGIQLMLYMREMKQMRIICELSQLNSCPPDMFGMIWSFRYSADIHAESVPHLNHLELLMSAIKDSLLSQFDVLKSTLEEFVFLEVTYLSKGALIEGKPEEIDAFREALAAHGNRQISISHSALFPDMVAITFKL